MITEAQIKKEYPNSRPDIVAALVKSLPMLAEKYGISTPLRLAHFLAQTAHESGGFRVIEENLNYSATGLNKIFPKYFINAGRNAAEYHRQPQKIANLVYASRMGNGGPNTGDGYKFRGRGLIQLTGRSNYTAFAVLKQMSIDEIVQYMSTPQGAIESAAWYWSRNGLNALADKNDIVAVTKRINGGTIGLNDRIQHTNEFKHLLGVR
jgi:putative chitinase